MKKQMELDLADLSEILEGFIKKLDKLSQPELIDLAARLKPIAKHCETIDGHVKEAIKIKLAHMAGELLGTAFVAKLTIIPVARLDVTRLKEEKPTIYNSFLQTNDEQRVTFHLR